jgi:hypothetical protein
MRRASPRAIVIGIMLLIAGAGCSSQDGSHISRDYLKYWEVVEDVSSNWTKGLDVLLSVAGGPQLDSLSVNIAQSREMGLRSMGEVRHEISEIAMKDGRATILDCVDLTDWLLIEEKTGEIRGRRGENRVASTHQFTLVLREDQWIVTAASEPLNDC